MWAADPLRRFTLGVHTVLPYKQFILATSGVRNPVYAPPLSRCSPALLGKGKTKQSGSESTKTELVDTQCGLSHGRGSSA